MKDLLALGAQGRKKKRTEETQHCFSSRHNDLFSFKTTSKCFSVKIDSYFPEELMKDQERFHRVKMLQDTISVKFRAVEYDEEVPERGKNS